MQSETGVPTTPKKEFVKDWLKSNPSYRNYPAGSDEQSVDYSEETVQSVGGQDDDINYMLSRINKNPQFVLEPPPTRKSKSSTTITTKAEIHRSLDENELEMNSSACFSNKKGDCVKIVVHPPGASSSGGSKPFVQIDSFADDPKILSPLDKITQLSSASLESFPTAQYFGEDVPVQRKDSIDHSSDGTTPSIDTPPYLSNTNVELYKESKYDNIVNKGKEVHVSPPSILLSSHASEGSSASFRGEGYVCEEDADLLGNIATTNENIRSQLDSNYTNSKATTGFCHVI